jgi:hypothetical protein
MQKYSPECYWDARNGRIRVMESQRCNCVVSWNRSSRFVVLPTTILWHDVDDNSYSHDESLNCFGQFGNRPNESDH